MLFDFSIRAMMAACWRFSTSTLPKQTVLKSVRSISGQSQSPQKVSMLSNLRSKLLEWVPAAPPHPYPLPAVPIQSPSLQTRILLALSGGICKTWTNHASRITVLGQHHLEAALFERGARPLITVCNHAATLDDPILFGLMPWRTLLDAQNMRWSLGAREICFTNAFTSWFFATGQVIPIVRGKGIHQPAMNVAIELLNNNRWVHVFPEARVNQSVDMIRFKWGVARLIMESKTPPILLPFFHRGMETMVPLGQHYPTPNTRVIVAFGQPIDLGVQPSNSNTDASHSSQHNLFNSSGAGLLASVRKDNLDDTQARIRITSFIRDQVEALCCIVNDKMSPKQ